MKIYTKTGDDGTTGLFRGPRVSKDHVRIEAYGEVDELNAVLGVVRAGPLPVELDPILAEIQHRLFDVGAELATPRSDDDRTRLLTPADVARLEAAIDSWEERLPPLREFVLPAGSESAAQLHWARTVCRRAERRVVHLASSGEEPLRAELLEYVNRLSDLLFVLARAANVLAGREDVPWRKRPTLSDPA